MHASVLASGSGGNCVHVESDGVALLVDCGLSVPELKRRLSAIGRDVARIAGVFVTHDHGDHVGSSVALARKLGVTLFATAGTHSILRRLPVELARTVSAGQPIALGPFDVLPVATPHDGIESVAFRVTEVATKRAIGVVTDLGYVQRALVERFAGVHALVVEHNHDERLLIDGPYPRALKERILSLHGHLSNDQGALLASHVMHRDLKRILLAHLSETNNTPDHARRAFERVNRNAHIDLVLEVAQQHVPSPVFEV